jgi:hypothetical protein
MSRINSEEELKKILNINNLDELKKPEVQKRFLSKSNELSPELLKTALTVVPELITAFTEVIKAMGEIGTSLEESKRVRWKILQEITKSGDLNGDQILEAMKIIQEIEKNENIDWESIFRTALKVLGVIAGVVVWIISRGKIKPRI